MILKISLIIILNGLSYVATTKEHSTIVVRNYGDNLEKTHINVFILLESAN